MTGRSNGIAALVSVVALLAASPAWGQGSALNQPGRQAKQVSPKEAPAESILAPGQSLPAQAPDPQHRATVASPRRPPLSTIAETGRAARGGSRSARTESATTFDVTAMNVDCGALGNPSPSGGPPVGIAEALLGADTIVVKGTCIANLVITRDNVTLTTDGVNPAVFQAADPNQPVIQIDGAQRVVINGVVANGITVSGGTFGVSATRGATGSLANCDVSGASNTAVISSYGSTLEVDNCVIHDANRGATAANTASLIVTNSTARNNTNEGLLAVRSSYLRVGQDRGGNPVARPVTVNNNGTNGISVIDSSSGTIVASNIHHNGSNGILFQRGGAGSVGVGSNSFV